MKSQTTVKTLHDSQQFADKTLFYMRDGMYINDIIHNRNTDKYTILYSNGRMENVSPDAKIEVVYH